jgi:hypothetical protein
MKLTSNQKYVLERITNDKYLLCQSKLTESFYMHDSSFCHTVRKTTADKLVNLGLVKAESENKYTITFKTTDKAGELLNK